MYVFVYVYVYVYVYVCMCVCVRCVCVCVCMCVCVYVWYVSTYACVYSMYVRTYTHPCTPVRDDGISLRSSMRRVLLQGSRRPVRSCRRLLVTLAHCSADMVQHGCSSRLLTNGRLDDNKNTCIRACTYTYMYTWRSLYIYIYIHTYIQVVSHVV